jgi:hypothetical protein
MTLDDAGLVTITGDLNVTGHLVANTTETSSLSLNSSFDVRNSNLATPSARHPLIAASQNDDLEFQIASTSALIVKTGYDDPVVEISASGSARFNDLTLSANSSGLATIRSGEKVTTAPALKATSQVILTFEGDYSPARQYWITKDFTGPTPQFTLHLDYPVQNQVNASWLIIN